MSIVAMKWWQQLQPFKYLWCIFELIAITSQRKNKPCFYFNCQPCHWMKSLQRIIMSSDEAILRTHLITHRGESEINAISVVLPFGIQPVWGHTFKNIRGRKKPKKYWQQTGMIMHHLGHLKTHSGENQTNATNVTIHIFVQTLSGVIWKHTAENLKPKKCYLCDFASSQTGNLRRHMKTHSG